MQLALVKYCKTRNKLILDNFQQVIGAAPVVRALLAAAPRLRILLTSRTALRLSVSKSTLPPRSKALSLGRLIWLLSQPVRIQHVEQAAHLVEQPFVTLLPDRR